MVKEYHHTGLFVSDLERSIAFYCDNLGFELLSRDDNRSGNFLDELCGTRNIAFRLALVCAGGQILELIEPRSPVELPTDANAQPFGIARIGFEVTDIERMVVDLRAQGVPFLSEVVTIPEGHYAGGKAVLFRDPDGIILELQEPGSHFAQSQ